MSDIERQQELISELAEIAAELGWMIAIPASEDHTTTGIVIGTQDFLVDILGDQIEDYDVMIMDENKTNSSGGLH